MDYQKKKMLSQSVGFLQGNLFLNANILEALSNNGVITCDEFSTIQKDELMSGKILELVCCLKRKDNRTYNKFIDILDKAGCTNVVKLFKTKRESGDADRKTVHFLETQLKANHLTHNALEDLASRLVLKEVMRDEVAMLEDRLDMMTKAVKARHQLHGLKTTPEPEPTTPPAQGVRVPSRTSSNSDETDNIIHIKDKIIERQDKEYNRLKHILKDTQDEMERMVELNDQYLTIINTFNQMQQSAGSSGVNNPEREEMEQKIEELEDTIKVLTSEMESVASDIAEKEKDLGKLKRREEKYKTMLGLSQDADADEVEAQIEKLLAQDKKSKAELDKIRRELNAVTHNKDVLLDKLTVLTKDKEKIEFHMRQQELTMRKMKRLKTAGNTLKQAHNIIATRASPGVEYHSQQALRLPAIERDGSHIGLANTHAAQGMQYCVFCHVEVQPMKSTCRLHHKPIRQGKWTCCKDNCNHGPGCIQVPHFFIIVTLDKKVLLTDGVRYLDLS